jgi:hypothetical protein
VFIFWTAAYRSLNSRRRAIERFARFVIGSPARRCIVQPLVIAGAFEHETGHLPHFLRCHPNVATTLW